jgi:hypothetical protein
MNIIELGEKLIEEKMDSVREDGNVLKYVTGDKVWRNSAWYNMVDSFGIYFDGNKYCIFFTDHERGIPYFKKKFKDEESACSYLLERVNKLSKIR